MAEYLVQDTSLISIGDKVRALSGVEGSMSLNTMRDKIEAASNEVVTQSSLINQVKETLLEKINAGAIISTATVTPTSNSTSINFTGVTDTPVYFCVAPIGNTALSSSSRYAINVVYDGNATVGIYSNRTTATYTTNGYSWTYSNGTLNVKSASTSNGGYFKSGTSYQLTYVTLPSITTDATYSSSISPSSNSTSISFSGLTSEPKYFAIIPTSNTTLSSSTRYALNVVYDGANTIGVYSNNSTATYTTNGFSWTYSNGTLTVKTASTSNGGYFRSGAEHKLIYVAAKSDSGNGTVSIENNTDGLQDIIQLMDNISSGVELNFEVVGGTTQPSNPKENTIWVNTSNTITSWTFSIEQPTSPSNGMMWFSTGEYSTVPFNALKNNSMQIYPVYAKQYVNGTWEEKTTKSYQNGEWQTWVRYLYIYKSGDLTGWDGEGAAIWNECEGNPPSIYYDNNRLTITESVSYPEGGNSRGVAYTTNVFDLTPYDVMYLEVVDVENPGAYIYAAIMDDSIYGEEYASVDCSSTGTKTIDISGINGEAFLAIWLYSAVNQGHGLVSFSNIYCI